MPGKMHLTIPGAGKRILLTVPEIHVHEIILIIYIFVLIIQ